MLFHRRDTLLRLPAPRCSRCRPRSPSSRSRSPASAPRSCRSPSLRFRDEDKSSQSVSAHHPRRPRAQRRVSHRRSQRRARRDQPAFDGRMALPRRRRAGRRLAGAPRRWPLRRPLQALGRRQGQRARRPEQRRRGRRAAPGRAPHRRLHLRKAHRRKRRVLDPHRLRHAGRHAATRCAWPMPTARTARWR